MTVGNDTLSKGLGSKGILVETTVGKLALMDKSDKHA